MILRIFATDGFTPERIFRWSVEETAEHLCPQQVLWVTQLRAPGWTKLVNWFVKQPCCRAVVLDTADRWDWNIEHEITWRIARGLYFQHEPEAIYWGHDDMAPPTSTGFKGYLKEWLASGSTALEAQAYQLWDDFDSVRADTLGVKLAGHRHCWLAKWNPDLRWLGASNRGTHFRPLDAVDPKTSPWPFRHAKGVDKDFREGVGFTRKGFCSRWPDDGPVKTEPYNDDLTWEEFKESL